MMRKIAYSFLILLFAAVISPLAIAEKVAHKGINENVLNKNKKKVEKILTFAVVPQQTASKLARLWSPIIGEVSLKSGVKIKFATAPDIPTFEKRLSEGQYDIAYMNPYHYVVFNQSQGYQAIAKARDKRIKGIIVVAKDSPVIKFSDLNKLDNKSLAFPAPAAFAATILTQSDLKKNKVKFMPEYVSSHDSVYRTVAKGIYPAGGGVLRTFNNLDPKIKAQLRILSTTKGYTPHAIAAHPRVSKEQINSIQEALTALDQNKSGKASLNNIKIKGFEKAKDKEWNDIRKLNISVKVVK